VTESFDAYHEWLGIAPEDQPPNHYRLVGIGLYESKANVVDGAVDRQMAHLRTFQTGPRAKLCQDLLNQLSAARVTLLDPDKKARYDAELKEKLNANKSGKSKRRIARALPLGEPLATAMPLEASASADGTPIESQAPTPQVRSDSSRHRGHRKKGPPWLALGIGGALLAVVAVVTMMAMNGGDEPVAQRPRKRTPKKTVTRPVKSPGPSAVVGDEPNEIDPPENKTTTVVPVKKVAATGKLPEYLRANKFDKAPTDVVKRKEKPVNPFDVAPTEKDPPAKIDPQSKEDPPAVAVTKQARPVVPPDEALKKADAEIREIFDFKAATDLESRKKLVAEIRSTALETKTDPVGQYAMLRMARDMSAHLGDYAMAEETINEMSERFDIDPLAMRSKAIVRAMTAKVPGDQRAKVARVGLELAKEFHQADRYKEALTVITAASRASARLKDSQLVADAKQMAVESRAMAKKYSAVRRALETLKTNPDDPAANTSVGKYLCFVKGDWQRGLPMLAKGDDAKLKDLATKEQGGTADTKEQVSLAGAWWDVGNEKANRSYREILPHAGIWYRKALPQLTGLEKAKVEKRLNAIEKSMASKRARRGAATTVIEEIYLDDVQEESHRTLNSGGWTFGKHGWLGVKGGSRVSLRGVKTQHALSMHPPKKSTSYVNYRLGGRCNTLLATAGISGNVKPRGGVIFVVYGNGRLLWKSPTIRESNLGVPCRVDVRGVDRLKLEVLCPGSHIDAHAVWFNPRVTVITKVKAKKSPRDAAGARARNRPELENVAVGGTATANSSAKEDRPHRTIAGNHDTNRTSYWAAGGRPPSWLRVQLPRPRDVHAIRLLVPIGVEIWEAGHEPLDYVILVEQNGREVPVVQVRDGKVDDDVVEINKDNPKTKLLTHRLRRPIRTSSVRLLVTKSSGKNLFPIIFEMEILAAK